jgi:hypothetical protein
MRRSAGLVLSVHQFIINVVFVTARVAAMAANNQPCQGPDQKKPY